MWYCGRTKLHGDGIPNRLETILLGSLLKGDGANEAMIEKRDPAKPLTAATSVMASDGGSDGTKAGESSA